MNTLISNTWEVSEEISLKCPTSSELNFQSLREQFHY